MSWNKGYEYGSNNCQLLFGKEKKKKWGTKSLSQTEDLIDLGISLG